MLPTYIGFGDSLLPIFVLLHMQPPATSQLMMPGKADRRVWGHIFCTGHILGSIRARLIPPLHGKDNGVGGGAKPPLPRNATSAQLCCVLVHKPRIPRIDIFAASTHF